MLLELVGGPLDGCCAETDEPRIKFIAVYDVDIDGTENPIVVARYNITNLINKEGFVVFEYEEGS